MSAPTTLAALSTLPRWVSWQTEERDGRSTKVPYSPTRAGRAHADKPDTWGSRKQAEAHAAKLIRPLGLGGIGIELGSMNNGMVLGGVDFDTCRDKAGSLTPWASEAIAKLGSYTEVSPSGSGAKTFFLATKADVATLAPMLSPKLARQFKQRGNDHPPAIELYCGFRYFAVTDQHLDGTPAELRPVPLSHLRWLLEVAGPALKGEPAKPACKPRASREAPGKPPDIQDALPGLQERIEAKATQNRALRKRWGGDWSKLRDESGSGRAFALAAALRKAGLDRVDTLAAIRLHPDTRDWVLTKGDANGGRELARIWDHLEENHLPPAATWLGKCQMTEKGEPIGNVANAMVAMREDTRLRDAFAYDEMLRAVIAVAPLPGDEPAMEHEHRPVRDTDVSSVQEYLQLAGLPRLGKDTTHQAVDLRAVECAFHPVRDYLTGLRWDGKKRLDNWLSTYLGTEATPYTVAIGRMFMVAMAARVFDPGCKADYVMVLVGPQGTQKSTVCEVLGGVWFSDNLPDIRSAGKDVAQHLNGKWLIEIAEMSSLDKAESAALKAFVTRTVERYRPSFGRKEVIEPRQCLFIGTTNKEAFLRDETGGRRFWPVTVGMIDIYALKRDRDQLFAEAVHTYRKKVQWWPDADFEREHIAPEQESRFDADAWEQAIAKWVDELEPEPDAVTGEREPRNGVTILDIAQHGLHMETPRLGTADQRRIAAILEHLGWTRGERTMAGRPWNRPKCPVENP